jgi:N-methylhydantoinase B
VSNIAQQPNQAAHPRRDPIALQIMWNRLIAVVEEQAQVLLRTAFSPIVRECGDLSAGVFDLQGRMLAQALTGTPGHVNTMAESAAHFIAAFPIETMQEGDAYICNDPWLGTGHTNDFVVATPVFLRGRIVALFLCSSHVVDVGGTNGPDAADVFSEGLYIPMLKLIAQGTVNDTLMAMIRSNTRLPIDSEGDTYALASCNEIGAKHLVEMMVEFGIESMDELGHHILTRSRNAVLGEIVKLPRGSWDYSMMVDGYDAPLKLQACLTITDKGIAVDFSGSAAPIQRGINVPLAYAAAYTVFALSCVVAGGIPNNAGTLSAFSVTAPPTTILNARKPHAVKSRHVLGQMLPDLVFGCLRQVIPERVPAEGTSCMWNISIVGTWKGDEGDSRPFSLAMTTNGGTGARAHKDGLSATAFPSGVQGMPVEIAEALTPLLFWRKELRPDSGGAGTSRGGLGQIIEIENGEGTPFKLLAAFDRLNFPPRGRDGGNSGLAGEIELSSGEAVSGKGIQVVEPGQRLILRSPGGGGAGDPRQRLRQQVLADMANGLISAESARLQYQFEAVDVLGK